jgi:hypothetical protein
MAAMQRCLSANVDCREREDALAMRASKLGAMLDCCLTAATACVYWTQAAHFAKSKETRCTSRTFFTITKYYRGEHVPNFA